MIQDLQTTFSGAVSAAGVKTGQAITATAISTNVLDLRPSGGPALVDEGILSEEVYLVVQAKTAAAGGDAAKTLTVSLESDSTANLATSPTVHAATGAILGSAITAGATLARIKLPSADYERYLGLRYTVSVAFTAFEVLAYLVVGGVDRNVVYPTSIVVA